MLRLRKGNDLEIRWRIMAGSGEEMRPYDLEGRELKLVLSHKYGKVTISEISVIGNELQAVFRGKDQEWRGVYSVTLIENDGQDGMLTVDRCDAFELVTCSCEEGGNSDNDDSTSNDTLQISKLDLGTDNISAYIIPVDAELLADSRNPVENRVVTAGLKTKVDIIEGKQLSTNDFTNELKERLLSLENYDDEELRGHIEDLTNDLKRITTGPSDGRINTFDDIISLLSGYREGDNLKQLIDNSIRSLDSSISLLRRDLLQGLQTKVDKIDGKGLSSNDFTDAEKAKLASLEQGLDGATFIPSVSPEGILSWTNNGGLPNPPPVNIMGSGGGGDVRPDFNADFNLDFNLDRTR